MHLLPRHELLYYILVILSFQSMNCQNETELDTGVPRSPEQNRLQNMRRRSRDQWISNLRQHVLNTLGFTSPPQINEELKNAILNNLTLSEIPYRAVIQQCFAGSCSLPNWIDDDMWNDADTKTLRIFFDILPSDDTVMNATLNLHIKERTACRCYQEDEDGDDDDSVRFTVFVSQFIKPLRRRNRVPRMKILDVKMVIVRRDTWVSFNVMEAVKDWMQRRRRRHGLEVNVIDSQGFPIDAKAVFGNVDCSLPVDVECQDLTIPVAVQKSLNYTTSPSLEVYTETRPNFNYRGKREATDEQVLSQGRTGGSARRLHKRSQFMDRIKRSVDCDVECNSRKRRGAN